MSAPAYRVYRDDELVLDVTEEPGVLVSTSAPPPLPGQGPVLHPFATASFYSAVTEGELGAMLRGAETMEGFLQAVQDAGYRVEPA